MTPSACAQGRHIISDGSCVRCGYVPRYEPRAKEGNENEKLQSRR